MYYAYGLWLVWDFLGIESRFYVFMFGFFAFIKFDSDYKFLFSKRFFKGYFIPKFIQARFTIVGFTVISLSFWVKVR